MNNHSDFENATHLFFDKQSVAECNLTHLQILSSPIAKIEAVNSDHAAQVTSSDDAGGLDSVIYISKHSKVMLTSNLWQQTGLCNGATGTVQDIISHVGHVHFALIRLQRLTKFMFAFAFFFFFFFFFFCFFVILFYVGTHLARGYSSGDPRNYYEYTQHNHR